MDDIYENVDEPLHDGGQRMLKNRDKDYSLAVDTAGAAPSAAENGENKHPWKVVAVCVGLLCLLLLIGLIVLAVLFTRNNCECDAEMALLHTRFNNLTQDNYQLQTSHNKVSGERDQLRTSYNKVSEERDLFWTNCKQLTLVEELQKGVKFLLVERAKLEEKLGARDGWEYFRGRFYRVSSGMKTWNQSRYDCLQRGADLLIINSREEQNFTNQFKKSMWIGLTDLEQEGTWKWVDGTTTNNSFWGRGEPNGGRHENCGSIKYFNAENSWNDELCSNELSWICEM